MILAGKWFFGGWAALSLIQGILGIILGSFEKDESFPYVREKSRARLVYESIAHIFMAALIWHYVFRGQP